MARATALGEYSQEQQLRAIALMRANRHRTLDEIVEELKTLDGMTISRSSVHRTLRKLNARDQLLANDQEQVIVTIVDRGTGEVRVIKTPVLAEMIESMIRSAEPKF